MEVISYIDGILGYRNGFYELVKSEPIDATYIDVYVMHSGTEMIICLNTGETEVNGIVPQTQDELLNLLK